MLTSQILIRAHRKTPAALKKIISQQDYHKQILEMYSGKYTVGEPIQS